MKMPERGIYYYGRAESHSKSPVELDAIRSKGMPMWASGSFVKIRRPVTDEGVRMDRTPAIIAAEAMMQVDLAIIAVVAAMRADDAPAVTDALQMNS